MLKEIQAMHSEFLLFAGKTCTDRNCSIIYHERTWYNLIKAGFNHSDVDTYLRWIADQNKGREKKYKRRFNLTWMFGDVKKFEVELNEARAWQRNQLPKPTTKELTLKALRPIIEEEVKHSVQSVKDITSRIMRKIQKDARGTAN